MEPLKCNVIINEVLPTKTYLNQHSNQQFIEFVRRCGPYAKRLRFDKPGGYVLLIVDVESQKEDGELMPKVVFYADLGKGTECMLRTTSATTQENYCVVGNGVGNLNLGLRFGAAVNHIQNNYSPYTNAIPTESYHPTAVLLLYFKVKDRYKKHEFMLKMNLDALDANPLEVTDELMNDIRNNLVDMFVYGRNCLNKEGEVLKKMYADFPDVCADGMVTSSIAMPFYEQNPMQSFSRCEQGSVGFAFEGFVESDMTPGTENKCDKEVHLEYPFNLKDRRLQSTAQKLELNVWSSIKAAKHDNSIYEGEAREVAARLTGLTVKQLTTANSRWRHNEVVTPGKHRKKECYVQVKIDGFDRERIRSILTGMYKEGNAPTLKVIYDAFMTYKEEQYQQDLILHQRNPAHSRPEIFRCSKQTFRKVLRIMGFKYGKINLRAGVLQQPYIVTWRGKYLNVLRKNEASDQPKKIVYLDETYFFNSYFS